VEIRVIRETSGRPQFYRLLTCLRTESQTESPETPPGPEGPPR